MSDAITVQQPEQAQRLVLLFLGVGDSANGMAALGRYFADALTGCLCCQPQWARKHRMRRGASVVLRARRDLREPSGAR